MIVTVEVMISGQDRPPAGTPITVQVRDTALQDTAATVLGHVSGAVTGSQGETIATLTVPVNITGAEPTVWVHVDVDRNGRVSRGDYVTTQSYPVPGSTNPRLQVRVNRV